MSAGDGDTETIIKLDAAFQRAVVDGDVAAADVILDDRMILATGRGQLFGKADVLAFMASGETEYDVQADERQSVRVWGDAAVITALLTARGRHKGRAFDYQLWFTDVYVRTEAGWRDIYGQASLPLPGGTPLIAD